MKVLICESPNIVDLFPATVGRAGFMLSCAGYRLIDLLAQWNVPLLAIVRKYIEPITQYDLNGSVELEITSPNTSDANITSLAISPPITTDPNERILLLNAQTVPSSSILEQLQKKLRSGKPCVFYSGAVSDGLVLAGAIITGEQYRSLNLSSDDGKVDLTSAVVSLNLPPDPLEVPVFLRPHDLIRYHLQYFLENQEARLRRGEWREVQDGLFIAGTDGLVQSGLAQSGLAQSGLAQSGLAQSGLAQSGVVAPKLGQYMVVNAEKGPILVDSGAVIGPYCYLVGPVYIGQKARIIEHAAIKDCVALGRTTKIGGEVEGSTIEPFTNKQHHGFLGHSYVGSWVNLGAGTCNSDLKNTYGNVTMDYGDERLPTDMQFLGCIIGDFAKSAINTSIFTGKTVGVCSMLYGFITRNVPSFVNFARSFGQVTEVSLEVLISTQARMFSRRNIQQQPLHIQLIQDMYEATKHERLMANEPLLL